MPQIQKLDIDLEKTDAELRQTYLNKCKWDTDFKTLYPTFKDWTDNDKEMSNAENTYSSLTGYGEQRIINKINELIKILNAKNEMDDPTTDSNDTLDRMLKGSK